MDEDELRRDIEAEAAAEEEKLASEVEKETAEDEEKASESRAKAAAKRAASGTWKGAALAGGAAGAAGGYIFGRPDSGNAAGDSYSSSVHHTSLLIAALVGFVVFYFDVHFNFIRAGSYIKLFALAYFFLGLLLYGQMAGGFTRWSGAAFRFVFTRWAFAFLGPYILILFQREIVEGFLTTLGGTFGYFMGILTSRYFPLIVMYYGGFTHWLLDHAGREYRIFHWLNNIITLLIIFALILPIFQSIAVAPLLDQGGQLEVPGFGDMARDSVALVKNWTTMTITTTQSRVNDTLVAVSPPRHQGQVESSQGRPLGVFIRDLQPVSPVFTYNKDGDVLSPETSVAVVYGVLHARTFADPFPVVINCSYLLGDERDRHFPARPSAVTIHTTGEYTDQYQFECLYDMDSLPHDSTDDLRGRFHVQAAFPFETWGYTTLTFMDRDTMRYIRGDPARELGINPNPTAKYTPGPVSLGMETIRQPIGIDTDEPDANYLPRFGITIGNLWASNGEVTSLNSLVLQVPDALELVYSECTGVSEDDYMVTAYLPGEPFSGDEVVPPGYVWYEFDGVRFLGDRYQTLQCPMRPSGSWRSLLGPDLSPRQYSLVARVGYDYLLSQPISNMRLGVVER